MLTLDAIAPAFACRALVRGQVTEFSWDDLHGEQTLVLLFEAIAEHPDARRRLLALDDAAPRIAALETRIAVISRDDELEVLAWERRPREAGGAGGLHDPIVLDSDGTISALYEMQADDGSPLWGYYIIDPFGLVRQASAGSAPVGVEVEELIRCLRAVLAADGSDPC